MESPWISSTCLHPKAKMGAGRNNLLLVKTEAENYVFILGCSLQVVGQKEERISDFAV